MPTTSEGVHDTPGEYQCHCDQSPQSQLLGLATAVHVHQCDQSDPGVVIMGWDGGTSLQLLWPTSRNYPWVLTSTQAQAQYGRSQWQWRRCGITGG